MERQNKTTGSGLLQDKNGNVFDLTEYHKRHDENGMIITLLSEISEKLDKMNAILEGISE